MAGPAQSTKHSTRTETICSGSATKRRPGDAILWRRIRAELAPRRHLGLRHHASVFAESEEGLAAVPDLRELAERTRSRTRTFSGSGPYEPGEIETLRVIDIDGTLVVISTRALPEPSAGATADFAADVLDSIRIERP